MKLKKLISLMLAGAMVLSMTACGGSDGASSDSGAAADSGTASADAGDAGDAGAADETPASSGDKLVVWTLAKDLEQFAEYYKEKTGTEVETVVIEPANYVTKVQTALNGGQKEPDIIVGEPQMLEDFYEAGYFEDLNQAPYNAQDYADQIVDYVWDVGDRKSVV